MTKNLLRRRVHNKILSVIMPFLSFWEILLLCENYLCEHTFLKNYAVKNRK